MLNDFLLGGLNVKTSGVDSVGSRMVTGSCFGTLPFTRLSMCVSSRNFCPSWRGIEASGPAVFFGVVGCLGSMLLVSVLPGPTLQVSLLIGPWRGCGCLSG